MKEEFYQELYAYIVENDKHPERGKINYNPKTQEFNRGSKRNGLYERWKPQSFSVLYFCENYRRNKLDGLSEKRDFSDNSLVSRESYKDGKLNGLSEVRLKSSELTCLSYSKSHQLNQKPSRIVISSTNYNCC